MRTGRSNNKGFSIVEMVIVIAILSIVSVAALSGAGIVRNAQNRRVAQSVYNALGKTKVNTMAKGDVDTFMELKRDADGYLVITSFAGVKEETRVGGKSVEVDYENAGSTASMSSGDSLKVEYERSSGVVKSTDFTKLTVGKYKVTLEEATGKCEIKRD